MRLQRQLNPAFADAHGLNNDLTQSRTNQTNNSTKFRVEQAIKEARSTGLLYLIHAGLTSLPDEIFDFRANMKVDLSMDSRQSSFSQYVEENLTTVDISDNEELKGSFDERLTKFQAVQILKCKQCSFDSINVSLISLEFLKVLDLSGNQLTTFDFNLVPRSLENLDLSSNQLKGLTATNVIMNSLTLLNVSQNQLVDIDCNLACPKLRKLILNRNRIKSYSNSKLLESSHNLLSLDISHNLLNSSGDDTPMDFSKHQRLQSLNLAVNRLSAVPTIPLSLVSLNVNANQIDNIRNLFLLKDDSSPALMDLNLNENKLKELPKEIEMFTNLKRLDMSYNRLQNLPYQLGLLPNIENLTVKGNTLYTFKRTDVESNPRAILEVLKNRAPKEEKEKNSSSSIMTAWFKVQSGSLNLEKNPEAPDLKQLVDQFNANPRAISGINRKLQISGFGAIPEELFPLFPNIKSLAIPNNRLKSLPVSLATSCPKLEVLDVSGNQLVCFSFDILSNLQHLQTLNLSCNRVESTDNWKTIPGSLIQLDLSSNQLTSVENLVWKLARCCPKLMVLSLARNKINKIPLVLGLLLENSLTSLDLKFNPQQAVRHAILERSCKEQLLFLKNRLTKEEIEAAKRELAQGSANDDSERSNTTSTTAKAQAANEDLEKEASLSVIAELQGKIEELKLQLDSNSLSQAKKYAVKKALAMEKAKQIREERKIGLRK